MRHRQQPNENMIGIDWTAAGIGFGCVHFGGGNINNSCL